MVGQIINNESIVTRGRNIVGKNVISQGGAVRSMSSWLGKENEEIRH